MIDIKNLQEGTNTVRYIQEAHRELPGEGPRQHYGQTFWRAQIWGQPAP